jgi:serine protease
MIARVAEPAVAVNVTRPRACPDSQGEPLSWGQKRVTTQSAGDVAAIYAHDARWGTGVNVYVLDTGVRITHEEFGGTAQWGANFAGGANQDANGHGTHCAGTIAGKTYGVAKGATIIAVKVLGDSGSGSFSGIISGIEWAVNNGKGIGNMSLGGGYNAALNSAVNAAAAAGVLFSNAAGNCNSNSCNFSPASSEDGVGVGSTELASSGGNQVDARSSFSNYGTCNHVFAPGTSIVSAYAGADNRYATLSGTSMAAPHVAGVAAIAMQENPSYSSAQLRNWITSNAMSGLVNNPGTGSPNLMLHVRC